MRRHCYRDGCFTHGDEAVYGKKFSRKPQTEEVQPEQTQTERRSAGGCTDRRSGKEAQDEFQTEKP